VLGCGGASARAKVMRASLCGGEEWWGCIIGAEGGGKALHVQWGLEERGHCAL
jgi:hypothetical protein